MTKIEAIVQLSRFEAVKGVCCSLSLTIERKLQKSHSSRGECISSMQNELHEARSNGRLCGRETK